MPEYSNQQLGLDDFLCNVQSEEVYTENAMACETDPFEDTWLQHCEEFAQALERERLQELAERDSYDALQNEARPF